MTTMSKGEYIWIIANSESDRAVFIKWFNDKYELKEK